MTRSKIVCTIGPACWSEEILEQLISKAMDVARLNFSHGTHESHKEIYDRIRRISEKMGVPIAIMQDLCGPKIRLGEIAGGAVVLKEGDKVVLIGEEIQGDSKRFHVSYSRLAQDLKPGEEVLIDDGLIHLEVEEIRGNDVICNVLVGGEVSSNKGVNLPHSKLKVSALTEKDIEDVKFGIELGVDFIALSFVREAEDINQLRRIIEDSKKFIPIIAKIEKREAVNNLDEILTASDGAMVARGDLGIEIPIEEVPHIQKKIIRKCNALSKPVITATQMLDSMIRNPLPTRAEASDIANAILDGTDAVMLSGETATGKYPVKALETMDRIAQNTENFMNGKPRGDLFTRHDVVDAITLATCNIADELNAKAIVVLTDSGRTARLASRYKPNRPILAVTYNVDTMRRLNLSWGVIPLLVEVTADTDKMLENASNAVLQSGVVNPGELVVSTAGIPAMVKGSTNMIKVDVLGHVFLRGTGAGKKTKITGKICIAATSEEAIKKVEPGDILITKRIEECYIPIANRLGGIVAEYGAAGSYADFFCERFQIPGILGVPGAMETFYSGRIVNLDTERGIIYGAKT